MKIGIVSDTHDNMPKIRRAMDVFRSEQVGHVIHGGDYIAPFTAAPFVELGVPFTGIFGNNDGERRGLSDRFAPIGAIFAPTAQLVLDDRKIVVMHEPDLTESAAVSGHFDLVVYGHTHKVDIRKSGATLIINPGEPCGWVTGRCTIVILDLGTMDPHLVDL